MQFPSLKLSQRQLSAFKSVTGFISGVALGVASKAITASAESHLLFWILVIAVFILLFMLINTYLNVATLGEVEKLDQRHRFRIEFIPAIGDAGQKSVHDRARAFLEKADPHDGCTIFAVNSYLEVTASSVEDGSGTGPISQYYDRIHELIKAGARYSRVVQLPTGVSFGNWLSSAKPHYKKHFADVLELQKTARQPILLMSAQARFPLSFVLFNNDQGSNYLIWQIDEQIPGDTTTAPKFKLHGIFLVEDPDRQIVDHFEWCFNQLLHTNTRIEPDTVKLATGSNGQLQVPPAALNKALNLSAESGLN